MIKNTFLFLVTVFFSVTLQAQSFAWGLKGGLTVGYQKWENTPKDLLLRYHGVLFIESLPAGNDFALFGQVGYHVKGSALRNLRANLGGGGVLNVPAETYEFNNLSLVLGAKQKFEYRDFAKTFYSFGIRGDYTLSTNLDEFTRDGFVISAFYPSEAFVRKLNYGMYIGGGLEFALSDLIGATVELSVSPDFSFQYQQPPLSNITDPFTGNPISVSERKVVNVALELTVGLRFLRIVEYY